MVEVNWDLLKFKYEILEYSLEDLATESQLSFSVLEYAAKEWEQVSLEKRQIELGIENSVETDVAEQTRTLRLINQKFLNPKYLELEATLLYKAITVAGNLDPAHPTAAKTIQLLTDTLKNLIADQQGDDVAAGAEAKAWEINIVDVDATNAKIVKNESTKKVSAIRNHQKAL